MKNKKLFYCLKTLALTALACVFFATCSFDNPIIDKWWVEKDPDVEYVPITKMIPQVTYETVIEHDIVNQFVIQQLPPVVIHDTIIQEVEKDVPVYIYQTVIEKVPEIVVQEVPVYIYQTVVEKVPEYIYETVVEKVPEYIYETVVEKVPEYIYQTIVEKDVEEKTVYEEVYEKVYETVHDIVHDTVTINRDPTEDEIKQYIRDHSADVINIIKGDDFKEIIKEYIKANPDEIIDIIKDDPDFNDIIKKYINDNPETAIQIIKQVSGWEDIVKADPDFINIIKEYIKANPNEVIDIIKTDPNWKVILKNIIQEIPPEELISYLTDDQIKYIVQQQPPQIILQSLNIIDIEYIIFAGNADQYNGPPGNGGSTPLTDQEKSSNNASVSDIAQALNDHRDYLIMLHGHANPTTFTDAEIGDLMTLSEDRAKAVDAELRKQYKAISGTDIDDSRVTVSGYGGEKVLFGNNSAYTPLNRRVEMILVWVGVKQ